MRSFKDLVTEQKETIVFTFGRFNPPTTGHEKLIKKVASVAGSNPFRIYPSHSQDPQKNPLPHSLKVAYMRQMFKRYGNSIVADRSVKTAIDCAVKLYDDGFKNITMVVGSDRVTEFKKLLNEYNGVKGKRHGFYKFDSISVVSAGERDPDAEDVSGMSASKMRAAAADGDKDAFMTGLPSGFRDGVKLYRDVRKHMGIREERDMGDMTDFETVRDMYLTGKIWNAGDIVEAKGVTGEVVRKGTNYLSFVDESGKVHKAWLHEIELTEELLVYDKTATYAKNKSKTIYAFGRDKKLDGQPKEKGGYVLWQLQKRYAGHVRGGIAKNWAYVKKDLSYSDAVKLMNKKLGFKGFNEEVELDEGKAPDVKKGDVIIVSKSKRPYKMGGMVDPKTTLPAESDKMVVKKVTKSKDGRKAHLTHHDPKKRGGYAIYLDKMPDFMSVKIAEEVELDERNYRKEYDNYHSRPEQIERRSSRNKARRIMGDKTKIGMDVGHKDNDPMNNDPKNLRNEDPSKNRREPRLREDNLDEMSWYLRLRNKIDQMTHPKGMEDMVKDYMDRAKEKLGKQDRNFGTIKTNTASKIAADVARQYNQSPRGFIEYINTLVKKGRLPKELQAQYEPQHETMSFKSFVDQIQINEKLAKDADAGDYIDDFMKSDAPQFKGKSKEKIRKMAIAAYLDAKDKSEGAYGYEKQDPDIKDKKGTQPAKYYKGIAKSTKKKRDAYFKKQAKKADDDPSAYKPAPGDTKAKTKPSVHTKKFKQMYGEEPRIPRKKGQPAGSDKHSDLYTDENPKGTIHGLGFKDVETAKASVKKIINSGKTHAHKIQAAIAMEQRARVMGKTAEANVYRAYIEKMKKKTKEMQKNEDVRKMPDGGYGVYADVFKDGKRVMTPGGKHKKELKKVYKNEKDANDYMAAIMIAKGGG